MVVLMASSRGQLCVINHSLGKLQLYIDGLVQERRISIALAMELRLSCTNPSIYLHDTERNDAKWSFWLTPFQPRFTNTWYFINVFDSLWPSDAIGRHRSESTLAQILASCLTVPSHYLHQCWQIFCKVLWHSLEGNFTGIIQEICPWYKFENYKIKITAASPRDQWINTNKSVSKTLSQKCGTNFAKKCGTQTLFSYSNM